jgi:hypothetical protein
MDGQRHKSGNGRRRRRKSRSEPRAHVEPILIAARRPNSPLIATSERGIATASAAPARRSWASSPVSEHESNTKPTNGVGLEAAPNGSNGEAVSTVVARRERSARIVQVTRGDADGRERERQRLMDRLMASETRGAITRAADEYARAGFEFPEEQPVQLQLLEPFDEERARDAIGALAKLFGRENPLKKPILEQRLRRLEEYADEPATRTAAADLRRAIR